MATSSVAPSHARPTKILFDKELSQKKRRELFLDWQQRRRDEVLDKIRQLEAGDGCSDSESDIAYDFLEVMKSRKRKYEDVHEDEEKEYHEVDEEADNEGQHSGDVEGASHASSNAEGNAFIPDLDAQGIPDAEEMEEHHDTDNPEVEVKKKRKKKKKKKQEEMYEQAKPRREAPIKLMLSEWLTEKPEDFEENWAGVLCPVGKRTLLVASRKTTKVFSRKGEYYGHFQSMLPSGNYTCYRSGNRTRGITMLDCIWSDTSQVFYVLDLICWNSHSCVNCDMDYRQYFLASKFAENPELQERNRQNRIPMILLPYFRALDFCQTLHKTLYPIFPEPVDGLLFYHRDGFYIPETNPLCLWILLTQVQRRLGLDLPIELRSRQKPPSKRQPPRKGPNKKRGEEFNGVAVVTSGDLAIAHACSPQDSATAPNDSSFD